MNKRFQQSIIEVPRIYKQLILMCVDYGLFVGAAFLALYVRVPFRSSQFTSMASIFTAIAAVTVILLLTFRTYDALVRSFDWRYLYRAAAGIVIASLLMAAIPFYAREMWMPRSVPVNYAVYSIVGFTFIRYLYQVIYGRILTGNKDRKRILVFGTGVESDQIASYINRTAEYQLMGFVSRDRKLRKKLMRGRRIYSPDELKENFAQDQELTILLPSNTLGEQARSEITNLLSSYQVSFFTAQAPQSSQENPIRKVVIDDLLGRQAVPPLPRLFEENLVGKSIFVTGGAGSIGSEIVRQIFEHGRDCRVVVYDQSEYNLYTLDQELNAQPALSTGNTVRFVLGDICDLESIAAVFAEEKPHVVYHAAAYKHVPIGEMNPFTMVSNNVLGTKNIIDLALRFGTERFTLVSTDKAVRPTNIMGASKRLSEILVQEAARRKSGCIFSKVRFGNVLGSSGSVVPKFLNQIAEGGPVTITHPQVMRYFMTIPEAAQLVIQAGFLAKGGELFVLDMGEPVFIANIAEMLVRLSGKTVKDAANPEGQIEIKQIGLRAGEKLREELLIGNNTTGTEHPKIMAAMEEYYDAEQVEIMLRKINIALSKRDSSMLGDIFMEYVSGFKHKPRLNYMREE